MLETQLRSVDHVMVRVLAAEPMMDLFSMKLGLPVSWPITRTEFATYGWVTLGNANLEFWSAANNGDLPEGTPLPLFHGFALEPQNLRQNIETLRERGITCKEPRPYVTTKGNGQEVTNFTNSVLQDVSGPLNCVFFCEWGIEGTIFPWKEPLTTKDRRAKEQNQLLAISGGILGITGLVELRVTTPNPTESEAKWLAITGQTNAPIALGDGVQLTLLSGGEEKIESVVIGVASLNVARSALGKLGLLGESSKEEVSLSIEASSGLHVRFREPRPL